MKRTKGIVLLCPYCNRKFTLDGYAGWVFVILNKVECPKCKRTLNKKEVKWT